MSTVASPAVAAYVRAVRRAQRQLRRLRDERPRSDMGPDVARARQLWAGLDPAQRARAVRRLRGEEDA